MKHGIKGRKLNRTSSHRKALLANLAKALLTHERIKTTLPKAKELRPFLEKIVTLAKNPNLANKRAAFAVLRDESLVNKLFNEIGPRIKNRNGGYLRIMRFGFRTGDKAPMALIEFVDKAPVANDNKNKKSKNKSVKDSAKKTDLAEKSVDSSEEKAESKKEPEAKSAESK